MAGGNEKELSLILKAYDKGLTVGLKNAKKELTNLDKSTQKSNTSLKTMGTTAAGAASSVAKLALAYGAFRGAQTAVNTVVDFNTAMAEVSTLTDASASSLATLSDDIINISTRIPQTAQELAAAEYDIISAGVSLGDSTKVLELSAKAAIAGVTDTKTAVEAGVGVMNAYGKGVDDLEGIYDTLFQTVKLGVVRFEDLAQNLGKVTPIARGAGVEFKFVAAAVAQLTKGGLKAEIATTALRGAITALVSPGAAAKKAMSELGITWGDFEDTLQQIADAHLGPEILKEIIPDVQARTAVLSLSDNYKALQGTLAQMGKTAGAMDKAYKKMVDDLENQFKLLKNQITAAILKNKDFVETLHTLAESSNGAAKGIGTLASKILTVFASITTGWAGLVSYHSAMWDLNEVTLALNKAQKKWQVRLNEVNKQTGLNIKSSGEFLKLIDAGVISYNKNTGAIKTNTENLALWKDGLLLVGQAGKDFQKILPPLTDELAGISDEIERFATGLGDAAKSVSADMAAIGDEIESGLAEHIKALASATTKTLQEMVRNNALALAEMVNAGVAATSESFKQLQKSMNEAQAELNRRRAAEDKQSHELILKNLKVALAKGLLTQKQYNQKTLAENKAHWTQVVDKAKAKVKELADAGKQGTKEYDDALIALADAELKALETEGKLTAAVKKTGTAAKSTAKEISAYAKELDAWNAKVKEGLQHMQDWREQTKRSEFASSSQANIDKWQGADFDQIQAEINRQQKIIYSMSQWVSPEQKQSAQETINGLYKLQNELNGMGAVTDQNTEALDANTTALKNLQPAKGYAAGGLVPGSGSGDTVPAMLTPGEVVLPVPVLKSGRIAEFLAGLDTRLQVPALTVQKFAQGGPVQPAAKTVNLNFKFGNNQAAVGSFPENDAALVIAALERAQMVAL